MYAWFCIEAAGSCQDGGRTQKYPPAELPPTVVHHGNLEKRGQSAFYLQKKQKCTIILPSAEISHLTCQGQFPCGHNGAVPGSRPQGNSTADKVRKVC